MARIDWDRPYGTICGNVGIPGAKYDQDGMLFNAKGESLPEPEDGPGQEPGLGPEPEPEDEPAPEQPAKPTGELTLEKALAMRENGQTDMEIAEVYGVTRQKVTALCR